MVLIRFNQIFILKRAVMSKFQPIATRSKVAVRTKVDGTVVTYESPTYVGYTTAPSGKRIPRYMNKEEADQWQQETGNKVEKI
jgi:hypothetical protein